MRKELLLRPHDENFAGECLGKWFSEDLEFLVYAGGVGQRRKKMRDVFRRNKPDKLFIAELIRNREYNAVEIIASYYEFDEELQRMVINKDAKMRKAYHKHRQFLRILEQKFVRRAEKSEAQSYYSRYAKTMDKAAIEDCRTIKKLNMGCLALTLSPYAAEKKQKEMEEAQAKRRAYYDY